MVRRVLVGVVVLGITACGGGNWVQSHPDIAQRARTAPEGFVQPALDRWAKAEALTASYTLRVAKGIGRKSFDLSISVHRPADVDMLVLDPTGGIQAYLRSNVAEVGLYVAEDRVLYRGQNTRAAFERALGFDLEAADAVALVLGYAANRDSLPLGRAVWDEERRRIRVDHGEEFSVWLHPVTQNFDRVVRRGPQGTVTAEVLEWAEMIFPVPRRLTLEVEPEGYGIELTMLGNVRLNPEFPAGFFEIDVAPGTTVLPLEELAREGGLFRRTDGAGEGEQ